MSPVVDRSEQCSPAMAKVMMLVLVGDGEIEVEGTPLYTYFALMDLHSAHEAFGQLYQLPEGERLRDLCERLGLDGSPT